MNRLMAKKQIAWCTGVVSLLLLTTTALVSAQTASDFPTVKGNNARNGLNASPNTTSPGQSFLGWPAADGYTAGQTQEVIDSTDFANTKVAPFVGGPYDVNAYGVASSTPTVSSTNNSSTGWAYPTVANEAPGAYTLPARLITTAAAPTVNYNQRYPDYFYTNCTPSAPGGDGTTAVTPKDLRTFKWTFNFDSTSVAMGVYVWIPIGPTGDTRTGTTVYSQRYYVYSVTYGANNSQRQVFILDTTTAGGGFVQLGGPNTFFPISNTSRITVTLYNTVPRDPNTGNLLELINGQEPAQTPEQEDLVKSRVVYANAVARIPAFGPVIATPSSATLASGAIRVTSVSNDYFSNQVGSVLQYFSQGVVSSYPYNNGTVGTSAYGVPAWQFTPNQESTRVTNVDNNLASLTSGFVTTTGNLPHQGADYALATANTTVATATASYTPNLAKGSYQIYIFMPGSLYPTKLAYGAVYKIYEGSAITTVTVNQDQGGGWVQLGTRAFVNDPAGAGPLKVVCSNYCTNKLDPGRSVYTDAIRFEGGASLSITSSPIHANALIRHTLGGTPIATDVIIVADEAGRIHCLDAAGNAKGKTIEYWSYPSTPDPNNSNWFDPNLNSTQDPSPINGCVYDGSGGTLLAETPSGFQLSSGLIQRINGQDYLFIGTTNGRVYCIAMAGRGDFTASDYIPGTTQRVWTYPSTYPSTSVISSSALGGFQGSVAFTQLGSGKYAVIAPTTSGRIYAIDAAPTTTDGSTDVLWTFPLMTNPNLGAIVMTPSVDSFGQGTNNLRVFFGSQGLNGNPGRFFSLNANTGAEIWEAAPAPDPNLGTTPAFGDFDSGPATVSGTALDSVGSPVGIDSDTVFVNNQNSYTYAFNAETGANIWLDNSVNTGAIGGLTYEVLNTYNNSGTLANYPVVVVPGEVGHFYALFARAGDTNIVGGRQAWGYTTVGAITGGTANSNNWLYGADEAGYLYAFNQTAYGGGGAPGGGDIVPNNPLALPWENARVQLITEQQYALLRLGNTNYSQGTTTGLDPRTSPYAYDWGETLYMLVYNFPFATTNTSGTAVNPPVVNVTISTAGRTIRLSGESQQWNPSSSAPTENGTLLDGYAVIPLTLNVGGPQSLPPGPATAQFSITTQALNTANAVQQVQLNPNTARKVFVVANPIALSVTPTPSSNPLYAIGYDVNPANPQNLANGNNVTGQSNLMNMLVSLGQVPHNSRGNATFYVYDRSLMSTLLPPGEGLTNVALDLHDLAWQGDSANVYKPLNQALYPNIEDLPVNYPNTSLDYPNISHTNVSAVVSANGQSQNPLFSGVNLNPPQYRSATGTYGPIPTNPVPGLAQRLANEVLTPTPFQMSLDVPKYQPPNMLVDGLMPDSGGIENPTQQGYMARVNVYVQNPSLTPNGQFSMGVTQDPYRSVNFAVNVPVDDRISVATPNVDLGSLTSGIGLTTSGGEAANLPNSGYFGNFVVNNDGNVNELDIRIAKSSTTFNAVPQPWTVFSTSADPNVLLDSTFDLWSNIDATYAPKLGNGTNKIVIQKARTTDQVPTTLTIVPAIRANGNLGINGTAGSGAPNVGVTLPIGMPSGKFSGTMRVIENNPAYSNESLDQVGPNTFESYSDPTFTLSFDVRETRMTTSSEPNAMGMFDLNYASGSPVAYANIQPTAMRNAAGGLVTAWVSDRPQQSPASPASTTQHEHLWRIYFAGLSNLSQFTNTTIQPPASATRPANMPYSPLVDLETFTNGGGNTWFAPSVSSTNGYPAISTSIANTLFGAGSTDTIPLNSVTFGAPSFPTGGQNDPFGGSLTPFSYMGFVGEAQKSTPTGILSVSRLFGTQVSYGSSGSVTAASPDLIVTDDTIVKGKPSVVQSGTSALLFYPGTSANGSSIYVAQYPVPALSGNQTGLPADHNSSPLNFGTGFVTVDSPSATGRIYKGVNPGGNTYATGLSAAPHVIELTFGGKLRGQPNEEVFIGRLATTPGTLDVARNSEGLPNPFLMLPLQNFERLSAGTVSGTFRTRGVDWNTAQPIQLIQQGAGGNPTNLLLNGYGDPDANLNFTANGSPNTEVVDRETGIISYDTRLGGKVYIDPALGTVKFSNALPTPATEIRITYQPRFLRVVQGGVSAYSTATGLFDGRIVSDPFDLGGTSFVWRTNPGAGSPGVAATPATVVTNDRFLYTFNRASAGTGQASRPYMSTARFGVQLLHPIYVDSQGNPSAVTVVENVTNPPLGPFQLDPVNGRVYFTGVDEDVPVSITYTPADEGTGVAGTPITEIANVSLVPELDEQPILVEQAVNESDLQTFLDPFTFLINPRRPPLMWLFWSSTRNGVPDVYFETLAPQFLARPKSGN